MQKYNPKVLHGKDLSVMFVIVVQESLMPSVVGVHSVVLFLSGEHARLQGQINLEVKCDVQEGCAPTSSRRGTLVLSCQYAYLLKSIDARLYGSG